MTVRIGMVGTGNMGQAHIERIHGLVTGGRVVAVTDVDDVRAKEVADRIGATVHADSASLLASGDVDALMVCTHGPAHEADVLAAVLARKPVFCEKPLTPTADGSLRIMEAEKEAGRRLVTVGFMRRFDPGYRRLKTTLDSGELGETLLVHCAHRNERAFADYTSSMAITETAIHEIDVVRWLLGEEIVTARVDRPKRTSLRFEHLQDPMVLVLGTESGARVDVEVFVNCQYGYDIRCEVVAERGTVSLPEQVACHDHNDRFGDAFVTEMREWVDAVARGEHTGPTAWDGYAAACVCDAAVRALDDGGAAPVRLVSKPAFYA